MSSQWPNYVSSDGIAVFHFSMVLGRNDWTVGMLASWRVWAAVFTFNPYLLISINELLISIIHLLISINELLISINDLFI